MKTPSIHLNGTPGDRLLEQVTNAAQALDLALRTMAEAAPNARDYYPQEAGAFGVADDEHGRSKAFDHVDPELGKLYAVTRS